MSLETQKIISGLPGLEPSAAKPAKPTPTGKSTPQSEADAAKFYAIKEDEPKYGA